MKAIKTAANTIKAATRQKLERNALSEQVSAANTIKAATSRKVAQNDLSSLKQELGNAATTLQNFRRNTTAKREMMKQRKTVDDAKLKQMQADKQRQIEQASASTLQSAVKRQAAQGKIKDIKLSKDKIEAFTKRLLTERVRSDYSPTINKTMIWNKNTVGQKLAYSDRSKTLVSKKKRDAAVQGYQNRLAYLDVADKYGGIMNKKKK